jgi:hypothetical protein
MSRSARLASVKKTVPLASTKIKVVPGHPRLWLAPQALPEFRKLSLGFRRPWRERLLGKLDGLIAAPDCRTKIIGGRPDYPALALGLAWRLTGKEKYAAAAELLLSGLEGWVGAVQHYDAWGMAAEASAYLYDGLHDYWKKKGRDKDVAEITHRCARRAFNDFLHRYILDDWHNYALGSTSGALAGALAVGDDHCVEENAQLLQELRQFLFTGLRVSGVFLQDAHGVPPTVRCLETALKAENGLGFSCLWESSGSYHSIDIWEVVKIAELWTHGIQRKERCPLWPELHRAGEALLQMRRPDGRNFAWGDARPVFPHFRLADIFFHLNARKPDPLFVERLQVWGSPDKEELPVHALLCATPETAPRSSVRTLPSAAPPASVLINPLAILRSGWTAEDTLVTFRNGRWGGWHNHLDYNGFSLFRGGALALDSGGVEYGGPHRPEYAMRTIAHNCILVRDNAQKCFRGRFNEPTVNDGGQRLVNLSFSPPNPVTGGPHGILTEERRRRFQDELDLGQFLAFETRPKFDYVAGDATRAYTYPWSGIGDNPSRRVEEMVRQLVFLKPDWVIIFDRVEATKAAFEKKWLLHAVNAPYFDERGQKRQAAAGGENLNSAGPFEFEQENGRLTVWALPAERYCARVVGGPGYEAWVDNAVVGVENQTAGGKNYPPTKPDAETGAWRLEFSPRTPAKRTYFLTVLHAGLRKDLPAAEQYAFHVSKCANDLELLVTPRDQTRKTLARICFREKGPVEVKIDFAGEHSSFGAPAPKPVPKAKK